VRGRKEIPKLDVAASLPVARSDDAHQGVAWLSDQGPALLTKSRQAPNTSWGKKARVSRKVVDPNGGRSGLWSGCGQDREVGAGERCEAT
jgi:hypothetical protein